METLELYILIGSLRRMGVVLGLLRHIEMLEEKKYMRILMERELGNRILLM